MEAKQIAWDDKGRAVVVSDGISKGKQFGLFVCKPSGTLKRIKAKSVPMVDDQERAMQLGIAYAARKGWTLTVGDPPSLTS